MRYHIGEIIPVIAFRIYPETPLKSSASTPHDTTYFLPWEVAIISPHLLFLTVTERHMVPNAFDQAGAATCEGYILTDHRDRKWHNQYPAAHYGQLDDSCDRLFSAAGEYPDCLNTSYVTLFSYLEGLLKGDHDLRGTDEEKADQLMDHYRRLVYDYQALSGLMVVVNTAVVAGVELPGHFTVTSVPQQDEVMCPKCGRVFSVEKDKLSMDKRSEILLGSGCCDECPAKRSEPEEADLAGFAEFKEKLEVVDIRTWPALPSTLDSLESGKCFAEMTIQADNMLIVANTWEAALNYLIKRGEPISRFYDFQQLG